MNNGKGTILAINPWIYDFAAYDLWMKPLGLLYILGVLKKVGFDIHFIDCLDRHHPKLLEIQKRTHPKNRRYGCGKFFKEILPKPSPLEKIPRFYGRYGIPEHIFEEELKKIENPLAILITSGMIYWYPGVTRTVQIVKEYFPHVPVILGGIYPTLLPQHAKVHSGADYVIEGEGEIQILKILGKILGIDAMQIPFIPEDLDSYPTPAWEFVRQKDYSCILSSRGCPFHCSYCAVRKLWPKFQKRNPKIVANEICYQYENFGIRNFAFYDDALLVDAENHFLPLMEEILRRKINANFHTPNGLHIRFIQEDVARMMRLTNFKTIRLGLETAYPQRQISTGGKVYNHEYLRALRNLDKAGFSRNEIEVYVMIGLAGQSLEEVQKTIEFVAETGVIIRLAEFSPIPGTEEWQRAVQMGLLTGEEDPLLLNNTLIPCLKEEEKEGIEALKGWVRKINERHANG